ncbi:glycosyl hydrolase family 76 [Pedobacter chinensis]|uniref:Glycosyl hydrolase family 76 n=1 Tax=Pedobacter chinensis TaxID=2282421 RepID=A0A369Q015_9SPHI|nr:glycoside hydrolase family 76 protein [Pedobacter chinensis]RDC58233.1 glycosyl hydrolase family 76 [Pedobacter chinensis]
MNKFLIMMVGVLVLCSCSKINDEYRYEQPQAVDWQAAANSSTNALIDQFWNSEGYFNYGSNGSDKGFQYWPNAHAMDVVIDAFIRTGNQTYSGYFDKWFTGIRAKNGNTYSNVFYDDMEWNALTMLRLYQVTKDEKYLNAVKTLWTDIIGGWNETYADGGVAWMKTQPYSKNACSNGPASLLAIRLFNVTKDDQYKQWAVKIYEWQKNTLFERASGAVYDNINGNTNVISQVALTYNQGTFMASAVELYQVTGDKAYLNDAQKVANYTLTKCIDSSNNILRNEGDGDNALFKGIFMRYFIILLQQQDLNEAYRTKFETFLNNNAQIAWTKGCFQKTLLFGPSWNEPPIGEAQLTAQASACMLIEARAAFKK